MKFIPCRICAKLDGPEPGYYYNKETFFGRRTLVECDCHKKWSKSQEDLLKAKSSNIWSDAFSYNPERDYKGDKSSEDVKCLVDYVSLFPTYRDKMIFMYGPNGTQKTTLAMWVGAMLIQSGYSVHYMLMENLSVLLQPDFDESSDESSQRKTLHHRIMNTDLLIIDEAFDLSKMNLYKSGYQIPFLDRFIRERFDINKKGILFVSNMKVHTIGSSFNASLGSLIERNTEESRLSFLDVYIKEAGKVDPRGLFKRRSVSE